VRLHQPFSIFTAGERKWAIAGTKPASHLGTKTGILARFEDIVAAAIEESKVQLVVVSWFPLNLPPLTTFPDPPPAPHQP
jgi:hypothetical protein